MSLTTGKLGRGNDEKRKAAAGERNMVGRKPHERKDVGFREIHTHAASA